MYIYIYIHEYRLWAGALGGWGQAAPSSRIPDGTEGFRGGWGIGCVRSIAQPDAIREVICADAEDGRA